MNRLGHFLSRTKARHALTVLAIFAASFWVYRHELAAFPRGDQGWFMSERVFYPNDFEYFRAMISFPRTRHLAPGDTFLFRPAMNAVLALQDIFFRDDLFLQGSLSVIWHGALCVALYYLFAPVVSEFLGALLVGTFLVQYSGMEAILWRHISPYILGIFFFACALLVIRRQFGRKPLRFGNAIAMAAFFLSGIFYDAAPLALLVGGVTLFLVDRPSSASARKNLLGITLLPTALYYAIDALDFVLHPALPADAGPASTASLLEIAFHGVLATFTLLGTFVVALVAPFTLPLYFHYPTDRLAWDYSDVSHAMLVSFGLILAGFLFWWGKQAFQALRRKESRGNAIVTLLLLSYLVSLTASWGFLRVAARGESYLYLCTYNYYLTNFLLLSLIVLGTPWSTLIARLPTPKRLVSSALAALLLGYLACNDYGIEKVWSARSPQEMRVAHAVKNLSERFRSTPAVCYGGALSADLAELLPSTLLYRASCDVRRGKPLYAIAGTDGRIWLVESLALSSASDQRAPANALHGNPIFETGEESYLGKHLKLEPGFRGPLPLISVELPEGFSGGLVFNIENSSNFFYLFVSHHVFRAFQVSQGKFHPLGKTLQSLGSPYRRIAIASTGRTFYVIEGFNVLVVLPDIQRLHDAGIYEPDAGAGLKEVPIDALTAGT